MSDSNRNECPRVYVSCYLIKAFFSSIRKLCSYRFNDAKKLVAFAGVDPSVYSSVKFTASVNRITKRGSCRLRHALYMAVQSGIRDVCKKKTTEVFSSFFVSRVSSAKGEITNILNEGAGYPIFYTEVSKQFL